MTGARSAVPAADRRGERNYAREPMVIFLDDSGIPLDQLPAAPGGRTDTVLSDVIRRAMGERALVRDGARGGRAPPGDGWPFQRSVMSGAATTRIQSSETPGAASWPELGLVFESDATASLVPVVH